MDLGQCHRCGEGDNVTEILETAWLHRSKVNTCNEEWKSTLYGENSFYRTDEIIGRFQHQRDYTGYWLYCET